MAMIFDSSVQPLEVSGKSPGSHPHHSKSVNVAELETVVEHTTDQQDLAALQHWLRTAPTYLFKLQNISLLQVEGLEAELREAGHKVRYDWRDSNQTAVFRMATPLHNAPGTWLSQCVPEMQRVVQGSARCGKPFLLAHGDGKMSINGGESRLQPDNRIDVNVHFQDGQEVVRYCVPQPRIILETALSQSVTAAQDKAWEYLWARDGHTHAVIVVDMTWPVTREKTFVARIAVWGRPVTEDLDKDYPFESTKEYQHEVRLIPLEVEHSTESQHSVEPQHSVGSQHDAESPVASDESSIAGSGTLTQNSGDTTQVQPMYHTHTVKGSPNQIIETPSYVVVLDENDDADLDTPGTPPVELILDTFQFLRRCPKHPYDIPTPSEMVLPLAPLRHLILEALARYREDHWPQKRKAEAEVEAEDPAQSPLTQEEDLASTKSQALAALQDLNQRKKIRR